MRLDRGLSVLALLVLGLLALLVLGLLAVLVLGLLALLAPFEWRGPIRARIPRLSPS
jgi:hypothetical protein